MDKDGFIQVMPPSVTDYRTMRKTLCDAPKLNLVTCAKSSRTDYLETLKLNSNRQGS